MTKRRIKIARTTRKLRRTIAALCAASKAGAPVKLTENQKARAAGITKQQKQYVTRYGKGGVEGLAACHLQNPAPTLDEHARVRTAERVARRVVLTMAAINHEADVQQGEWDVMEGYGLEDVNPEDAQA